ncbi:MAG: ATP-binding cassette domain-containing protein [Proteobacteria bacterium]|nr:ATP-binding cassette domain-containing protein [Pseudomonadota bacterium]MBI3495832.1 ATP-binding cassette domain-containing protein [Pseudomonadota bacterium]
MSQPLLAAEGLVRRFKLPRASPFSRAPRLTAVDHVSLTVESGRSFGIVGESGSGKSTLARLVMALDEPDAGTVKLKGEDLFRLSQSELRRRRRDFQMVFQDPYGSLDPRHRVGRIVAEPLDALPSVGGGERRDRVAEVLEAVGMPADAAERYPHEFSGGQRQRIAISRALITRPALIVADEPVSALDVSVQAQVLNLMLDLSRRHGVTYLFISHNLAVVEHVAETVAVMYRGSIVEEAAADTLFANPRHPYTEALIAAVPSLVPGERRRDRRGQRLAATPLDAVAPPVAGCPYASRCPKAEAICRAETPALREVASQHRAACHLA